MTRRPRVLVVDDDALMLRSMVRWLRRRGYDVVAATSGAAALVDVEALTCAVFDIDLGDGCGIDFAEQLKKSSSLPIVFFSASVNPLERARAALIGTFVDKMAGLGELMRTLGDLVPRKPSLMPAAGLGGSP